MLRLAPSIRRVAARTDNEHMDLRLSDKHQALQQEVRRFVDSEGHRSPQVGGGRKRPNAKVLAWQALLVERGYAARNFPKEYGGFGAPPDVLELAIIDAEFSRAGIYAGIMNQGTHMFAPLLLELGTEAQRTGWIARTIRGEMIWSAGLSEREAGSDLAALRTSARVEDDEFVIRGEKSWVSSAHYADMIFLLCRTETDAPRHKSVSMLIVPTSVPGLEIVPMQSLTGRAEFNIVRFHDVRIPITNIVLGRGEGWKAALSAFKNERMGLGGTSKMRQRIRQVADLMKQTTIDGQRVVDLPLYRDRYLRLHSEVLAWQAHSQRLTSALARGDDGGLARLIVKYGVTTLEHRISSLALDILGSASLRYSPPAEDEDADIPTLWNLDNLYDIGILIGGGTSNIQRNTIAERGLGLPPEPQLQSPPSKA
jgi:alkylation response protein AidB-like acyl-CoA dehydrogenase